MKHLFAILAVCLIGLVGCGGDGTTDTPAETEATPGETVQAFANAMQAGDAEKLQSLCPDFAENLSPSEIATFAAQAAKNAQANGGIASITIDKEDIKEEDATVIATLTNGNGNADTETFRLYRYDGQWVIDMREAFEQLEKETGEAGKAAE